MKESLASDIARLSSWPTNIHIFIGPAAAFGLAVILFQHGPIGQSIPNPNLLFALFLVVSAYQGGTGSCLVTAFIAMVFASMSWAIPGHPLTYSPENLRRLVVTLLCMPTMAILVGTLKARAEAQSRKLTQFLAIEKERNLQLAKALSQTKFPEGSLPVCAWCHKAREQDGGWIGLEAHLEKNFGTVITHGICPECRPALVHEKASHRKGP